MNRPIATLCVALLLAVLPAPAGAQQSLQKFTTDRLTIETADGRSLEFEIELALTVAQRSQGLMFRRDLPDMSGMLFVYDKDWDISMWMKNTVIPLDMLFIKRDGRILSIAERAVPFSLETISPGQPASGVLEINGGAAARLGIHPGDRVRYSAFNGAP